ncbi:hypothetical protein JCM12294_02720 [Desulfocicer niacini]
MFYEKAISKYRQQSPQRSPGPAHSDPKAISPLYKNLSSVNRYLGKGYIPAIYGAHIHTPALDGPI